MGAVDRLSLTRKVLPQPSEEIESFGKFLHQTVHLSSTHYLLVADCDSLRITMSFLRFVYKQDC